jgi:hypothetical protein
MGRAAIALFIVAFFSIFVAFWTGIAGCWRRSPGNITATAILILLACEYTTVIQQLHLQKRLMLAKSSQ